MAASYPTAAKSFTTRNAGDNIQPSFVNDLQDEVVAMEQALLAGGANIHSSHSTVANLSVPGRSTLGDSPTFAGNCTIAGTLTVNKIVSTSVSATPGVTSYVRAYHAAGSTIQATMQVLPLPNEIADLLGEYDSTTYTFTPQSSGYYYIRGQVYYGGVGSYLSGALTINSSIVCESLQSGRAGFTITSVLAHGVYHLSSGAAGAVQFKAMNNGGAVATNTGVALTSLTIIKLAGA